MESGELANIHDSIPLQIAGISDKIASCEFL